MLTSDDIPTIEFALRRRLDQEPGAEVIIPILAQPYARGDWYLDLDSQLYRRAGEPFIRIGVHMKLGELITLFPKFDLPNPFEHGHLLYECDQIAEQCKQIRREVFLSLSGGDRRRMTGKLPGTGMRGAWDRYGTLLGRHG